MSVCRTVSEIFSVKEWRDLKTGVGFKVIENGAVRRIMYDFLLVGHCQYSCMLYGTIFKLFDVE